MNTEDTFTRTVDDAAAFEARRAGPFAADEDDTSDAPEDPKKYRRWLRIAPKPVRPAVQRHNGGWSLNAMTDNDYTNASKKEGGISCG